MIKKKSKYLIMTMLVVALGFCFTTKTVNANYAQTECQFRYCGTAIPFLTVRSTAR